MPATRSTIMPCLRYRDASAAIDWLCATFGFRTHTIHTHPDGTIAHAQLVLGGGMVMLGSAGPRDDEWDGLIRQPDDLDGAATQSTYVVVDDADLVFERARERGARILIPIRDESYGGRGFSCRDPDGHVWTFGTYDPW